MSSAFDLDTAIWLSQVSGAVVAISLIALQTDSISRKILSPLRLYTKRRIDQLHKVDNSIADSILSIRTHVNQGNNFEASIEKHVTELILDEESIQEVVDDIVLEQKNTANIITNVAPIIVGIAKDLTIPKNQWYVYLAYPELDAFQADGVSPSYNRRVQVPLIPFCKALALAFEEKLTSNTICFIADASSSLSSHLFSKIMTDCQTELGVPLVQEPAWMIAIALLMRRKAISEEETERILFAFCRLEAYKLELENKIGKRHKTVAFILPGQACTKALLPILQKLFPCERHVFAYDGCVASVQRGMALLKRPKKDSGSQLPITAMPRTITSILPLIPMQMSLKTLPSLLPSLSSHMAGIVEAWMSSVDTLIALKDDERKNGYTPFVCRMDFLIGDTRTRTSENGDMNEKSCLALTNVLQYVTGSRSRALDEATLDAAQSVLVDIREQAQKEMMIYPNITHEEQLAIETCVFAHKMILIGDKTLPDTVLPKKEWSLKAARKLTSCACCFPGEDGEEGSDGDEEVDDATISTFSLGSRMSSTNYVDGKTSFAFDPSKF
jgi:hypothetical protein